MSAPRVVPDLLRNSARLVPDRVAVAAGAAALTFAELDARASAIARGLRARGVSRGDQVGLMFGADAWPDYAAAYFGTLAAGATALLLGDRFTGADIGELTRRHAVVGIVTAPGGAAPDVACWVADATTVQEGQSTAPYPIEAAPGDAAEVIFTSGTTALPRGVVATHANVLRAQVAWPAGPRGNQPCLHALPIGSVAAQVVLVNCVGGQHTLVALPRFSAPALRDEAERWQASTICLAPAMGHWLLRTPGLTMPSVKGVSFSGAALPVGILADLAPVFPHAEFYNFYTSTEAFPAKVATRYDPTRPESVGRPIGACTVRVTGPDGAPLPAGETGEVWLRSADAPPRRFLGGDESQEGAATFRDGWTRTGDLGYVDVDGYLYLAGRASDIVIVGGFNVSTYRVEQVLGRHEAVAEAAVFPVDHRVLGEVVAALVVLRADATVRELREHAARHLSRRELPAVLRIVDEIPHNAAGKVVKSGLPALLEEEGPAAFVPPRGETERVVAQVWSEVLDVGSVGVADDFFAIGGDSLAATEIAARLGARLGAQVDAVSIFERPTVAELAASLPGGNPR
jgi:long-chain acyl-CoA synthetase